jgi:SAM-dependent methyltransferase
VDGLRHGRRFAATLVGHLRVPLLRVGLDQGLFDALRRARSPEDVAHELDLEADLVDAWMVAAEAHGLLRARDDSYEAGSFALWLLDAPEGPAARAMLDQVDLAYAPRLRDLGALLKGAPRPEFGSPEEARRTATAARVLERRALDALRRVPGVGRARRVLDVGCGEGTYLARFLVRYRDAQGVGVDQDPGVAEQARRVLREAEVSRRAEVIVGDFQSVELNQGSFDLVMLNNNLHYFDVAGRSALVRRLRALVRPGGVLAIQTQVASRGLRARWGGGAALLATYDLFLRAHRNLHGLPDPAGVLADLESAGFAETGEVAIEPDGTAVYLWGRTIGNP